MNGAPGAPFINNMMKIFKFFERAGYVRAINRLKRRGLHKQARKLESEISARLARISYVLRD
jgi:hypothetical protein